MPAAKVTRPPVVDESVTLHATELADVEAGPHGLTLVFTEDRDFGKDGPRKRRTVARVAISAVAATHAIAKMQHVLIALGAMVEGSGATKN